MTRTRRSVLAMLSAAALGLTGCGANLGAATQQQYQPAEGTNVDTGDMAIRSVLVVGDAEGNGSVVATFVNSSGTGDQLVQATVAGAPATITTGALPIPAGGAATLGQDVRAEVRGLSGQLEPGLLADVEFVFSSAPRTTLRAIVVEPIGPYAAYAPTGGSGSSPGAEPGPSPTELGAEPGAEEQPH